jgi:hypothetical protein
MNVAGPAMPAHARQLDAFTSVDTVGSKREAQLVYVTTTSSGWSLPLRRGLRAAGKSTFSLALEAKGQVIR